MRRLTLCPSALSYVVKSSLRADNLVAFRRLTHYPANWTFFIPFTLHCISNFVLHLLRSSVPPYKPRRNRLKPLKPLKPTFHNPLEAFLTTASPGTTGTSVQYRSCTVSHLISHNKNAELCKFVNICSVSRRCRFMIPRSFQQRFTNCKVTGLDTLHL